MPLAAVNHQAVGIRSQLKTERTNILVLNQEVPIFRKRFKSPTDAFWTVKIKLEVNEKLRLSILLFIPDVYTVQSTMNSKQCHALALLKRILAQLDVPDNCISHSSPGGPANSSDCQYQMFRSKYFPFGIEHLTQLYMSDIVPASSTSLLLHFSRSTWQLSRNASRRK